MTTNRTRRITTILAALAVLLAIPAAALGVASLSHVEVVDHATFEQRHGDFTPDPGQDSLGLNGFKNAVGQSYDGFSDRRLEVLYADACTILNGGFGADQLAGMYLSDGYGKRQARGIATAAVEFCAW